MKKIRISKRAENLCRLATGEGTTEEERRTAAVQLARLLRVLIDREDEKELESETAQKEEEARRRWWEKERERAHVSSLSGVHANFGPYDVSPDGSEWSFGATRVKMHP